MNYFTDLSIQYANKRSYLDDLFQVYPTIPEGIREVDNNRWLRVVKAFEERNNKMIIAELLEFDLFPIKDSYVAYLKRDPSSVLRNPNTINRLAGRLYEMGLDKIFEKSTEAKETNRQIGPLFKRWLNGTALGIPPINFEQFINTKENAILNGSDAQLMQFAKEYLNYRHDKGLDFIGRFNNKYFIGEAKFLTDFGGHQYAQFNDAISTITTEANAIKVAILDGVLYIDGNNKMRKFLNEAPDEMNIMSALVFREFLYQL